MSVQPRAADLEGMFGCKGLNLLLLALSRVTLSVSPYSAVSSLLETLHDEITFRIAEGKLRRQPRTIRDEAWQETFRSNAILCGRSITCAYRYRLATCNEKGTERSAQLAWPVQLADLVVLTPQKPPTATTTGWDTTERG